MWIAKSQQLKNNKETPHCFSVQSTIRLPPLPWLRRYLATKPADLCHDVETSLVEVLSLLSTSSKSRVPPYHRRDWVLCLKPRSPQILNSIPHVEVMVLRDLDALDAAGVGGVVGGVVDGIGRGGEKYGVLQSL